MSWDGKHMSIDVTPTYSGCPATELIEELIAEALACSRYSRPSDQSGANPRMDHRLDNRRRPGKAPGLWHSTAPGQCQQNEPAGRRRSNCLPTVRQRSTPSASANSALQPARRCIAALIALNPSTTSNAYRADTIMNKFYSLPLKEVRPETRHAVSLCFDLPRRCGRKIQV